MESTDIANGVIRDNDKSRYMSKIRAEKTQLAHYILK